MRELTQREADLVSGAAVIFIDGTPRVTYIKLGPIMDPVGGLPNPGWGVGSTGGAFSSYGEDPFGNRGTGGIQGGS